MISPNAALARSTAAGEVSVLSLAAAALSALVGREPGRSTAVTGSGAPLEAVAPAEPVTADAFVAASITCPV